MELDRCSHRHRHCTPSGAPIPLFGFPPVSDVPLHTSDEKSIGFDGSDGEPVRGLLPPWRVLDEVALGHGIPPYPRALLISLG